MAQNNNVNSVIIVIFKKHYLYQKVNIFVKNVENVKLYYYRKLIIIIIMKQTSKNKNILIKKSIILKKN